jgi:predicted metal-dependent enzyme (double-stranded beta helix superfamily)
MSYGLEQFCKDARNSVLGKPGEAGLAEVRDHLAKLLASPADLDAITGPNPKPGKHVAYHDDVTDMYVLLLVSAGAGRIPPHDHGDSWAVYGVVRGSSEIEEWRRLDDGSVPGTAKIEKFEQYQLKPGMAKLYHNRMIHTTDSAAGTLLVRVTGTDLENIETLGFDTKTDTVRARANHMATKAAP